MSKGSYRGASTLMGWNANIYVAPSLSGRKHRLRAQIHVLTARTAQTREEALRLDVEARKRQKLKPPKHVRLSNPAAREEVAAAKARAAKKPRPKRKSVAAGAVAVEKRKLPPRGKPRSRHKP
jgi:hypothetical protein